MVVVERKKTFSGSGRKKAEDKLKTLRDLGSAMATEPPKPKKADIITPTPERLAKMGDNFSKGGDGALVARDAPLETLYAKRAIDDRQYNAGKKFYHHWYRAGLNERYAALNLASAVFGGSATTYGMPANEDQAYHREAYRKSTQHLGMRSSTFIQYIICDEAPLVEVGRKVLGWANDPQARAAATEKLKDALDRLADFYGM